MSAVIEAVGDVVGGIVDAVGDIVEDVAPIALTVAKFFPATAPYAYAISAVQAAADGNALGVITNAMGAYGAGLFDSAPGVSDGVVSEAAQVAVDNTAQFADSVGEMVKAGELTVSEGTEAMRAWNNAVTGNSWGDFATATEGGFTQLAGGFTPSLVESTLAQVPGLEFFAQSPASLTPLQAALKAAAPHALTGGLSAAANKQDVLEGALIGGVGSALGNYLGNDFTGGASKFVDKLAPSVLTSISKDIMATGGTNLGSILEGAGYGAIGQIANSSLFDQFANKPVLEGDTMRLGNIAYSLNNTDTPVGYYDSNNAFKSYADVAGQNGGIAGYNAYLDNTGLYQASQGAGAGISALLKTGDLNKALLAALPNASAGAMHGLLNYAGLNPEDDVSKLVQGLTKYGVSQEIAEQRAQEIAEARKNSIYNTGIRSGMRRSEAEGLAAAAPGQRTTMYDTWMKANPNAAAEMQAQQRQSVMQSGMGLLNQGSQAPSVMDAMMQAGQQPMMNDGVFTPKDGATPKPGELNLDPALKTALESLKQLETGVEYA